MLLDTLGIPELPWFAPVGAAAVVYVASWLRPLAARARRVRVNDANDVDPLDAKIEVGEGFPPPANDAGQSVYDAPPED